MNYHILRPLKVWGINLNLNRSGRSYLNKMIIGFSIFIVGLLISVAIITPISKSIHKNLMKTYLSNVFEEPPKEMIDGEYYKVYDLDVLSKNDFFYIYNEKGDIVYRKDSWLMPNISLKEIELIPYENNKPIVNQDDYIEFDSNNYIYIDLDYYENLVNVSSDYYILDYDLNIIETNVNSSMDMFTEKELKLIQGDYLEQWYVSKMYFDSKDGESLIAVIFRDYSMESSIGSDKRGYEFIRWILLILLFLIATPIYILTLYKNVKEPLNKLDEAIKGVADENGIDLISYEVPKEFQSVFNDFNDMALKLEKSKKETKKQQIINRRIIANVSHDLKTPLTVIKGYSSALLDNKTDSDKQREYYLKINEKTQIMTEMVTELNDYSRLNHPEFKMNRKRIDILDYFRVYFDIKSKEIEFFGYNLSVEIPNGELFCKIDEKYFERIFENIINNTFKHTPKGTGIFFRVTSDGGNVLIEIGDDGPGIPVEYEDHIFKPFTTNDEARGTGGGMGMAIAKMIVEYHHGSIGLKKGKENELIYEIKLPKDAS